MLESTFQNEILKPRLKDLFPGCTILKNDPNMIQGIPDLTVMYHDRYAILEVKKSKRASHQPNQDFYIDKFNNEAFGAFIYPENMEEVLTELSYYFTH